MVKKRVLFLMSDTGGGHRAAAEAITDALIERYGAEAVETELVDVFRDYCFPPFKWSPEIYRLMVNRSPKAWGRSFWMSNGRYRSPFFATMMYWINLLRMRKLPKNHPADVVVSVHSILTRPSMRVYQRQKTRPPFITVVTDLAMTTLLWYEKDSERTLVATPDAYDRGIYGGLTPDQLRITGLPVHPKFTNGRVTKEAIREEMGWKQDVPTVVLVGGGDGMGPLGDTALKIRELNPDCQLVVVCGKNEKLVPRLQAQIGDDITHIYPFVEMKSFMAGADILVTKAGPATISEACVMSLPLIISGMVPGQEEGNVAYVQENDAGEFAPTPQLVAETVREWLDEGLDAIQRRSENAQRIARPDAVWEVAEEIWHYANQPRVDNN